MKKFLILLAAVFLLSACKSNTLISNPDDLNPPVTGEETTPGIMPLLPIQEVPLNDAGGTPSTPPITDESASAPTEPTVATAPSVKTFEISAKKWAFSPSVITVNQGDSVKLIVSSVDVEHGFSIPDFGVSETLYPGSTKTIEFVADKAGTFNFFCSVYCGDGHSDMNGQLIVQ